MTKGILNYSFILFLILFICSFIYMIPAVVNNVFKKGDINKSSIVEKMDGKCCMCDLKYNGYLYCYDGKIYCHVCNMLGSINKVDKNNVILLKTKYDNYNFYVKLLKYYKTHEKYPTIEELLKNEHEIIDNISMIEYVNLLRNVNYNDLPNKLKLNIYFKDMNMNFLYKLNDNLDDIKIKRRKSINFDKDFIEENVRKCIFN